MEDITQIEPTLLAFRRWIASDVASGNPSPSTRRCYLTDLRHYLRWLKARDMTFNVIGATELKAYTDNLIAKYADSTVLRRLSTLRRFYDLAYIHGMIEYNPTAELELPDCDQDNGRQTAQLSQEELHRLLITPDPNTPRGVRDRLILVLMVAHRLRVSDIHRLNVDDVDKEVDGTVVLYLRQAKCVIELDEITARLTQRWLTVHSLYSSPDSQALFIAMHWSAGIKEPGFRISKRGIRQVVDGYLQDINAKSPGVSCHALRHSGAAWGYHADPNLLNSEIS